jgi:hypothetical protein
MLQYAVDTSREAIMKHLETPNQLQFFSTQYLPAGIPRKISMRSDCRHWDMLIYYIRLLTPIVTEESSGGHTYNQRNHDVLRVQKDEPP